ncbi:MAG: ArdC family protein, partial [Thermodesulfobacteriota bacterium]
MLIKVKEYQEKMMEGVQKVLESGEFKEFLAFGAKFRNYSFGNTLLIWSQNSEASHVAGFRTWKSLGRWVKKGEKGIVIFAPMIKGKNKKDKKADAGDKDDGFLIGFKAVYVYDLSQTEGEPIPEMRTGDIKNGDCDSSVSLLEQILDSSPVPVTFDTFSDDKRGVYMIKD